MYDATTFHIDESIWMVYALSVLYLAFLQAIVLLSSNTHTEYRSVLEQYRGRHGKKINEYN